MSHSHWIERTSPKGPGYQFVGTCRKCGEKNLTIADMAKPCANVLELTKEQSLLGAITGKVPTDD